MVVVLVVVMDAGGVGEGLSGGGLGGLFWGEGEGRGRGWELGFGLAGGDSRGISIVWFFFFLLNFSGLYI